METTQTNMETTQTNRETTLWHELDEQTSETISGGAEGVLAWSIRYDYGGLANPYKGCDPGTCC
ncbi:MAG: hypothetical protein Fur006_49300 [Coleofasciculaceae cyanobacterium]